MIENRQFRQALGQFATGVTIVTALDGEGRAIGVTASSFNAVSLDPPLVLWSIGKSAYSYPAFARAGHFAVHVLDAGQRSLSDRFAQAATDKFAGLDVGCGLGEVPLLPGCLAVFECATEHRYEGGDHLILVGRVLRMDVAHGATQPLLFHRGRYAELVCAETV